MKLNTLYEKVCLKEVKLFDKDDINKVVEYSGRQGK